MTNITTYKLAAIERRKAALEADLRELGNPFGHREELRLEHYADPIDQVTSTADRDLVISRLNDQTRRMHDIQAALARLEDGSYGVCEQCDEPINPKRLDAIPWAALCVACQSRAEARRPLEVAA